MAELVCVDGSVLSLQPVPVVDRGGLPYEATLRLLRDREPFGEVGERCAGRLAETAGRLRDARRHGDGFPEPGLTVALRALDGARAGSPAVRRVLPRDGELLALRGRDPDDVASSGELRVWLRDDRTWHPGSDGVRGRWSERCRAVLDAWGAAGTGVRCLLDSAALLALLERLVDECVAVGALDACEASEAGGTPAPARG